MDPSLLHLLVIFCFTFYTTCCFSHKSYFPNTIIFPLTKDVSSLHYTTHLNMGTPKIPANLIVDLSSSFISVDCSSRHVSSSHHPIHCGSLHCSRQCDLAEHIMAVDYVDYSKTGSISTVHPFIFSCAPALNSAKGMLGFGRNRLALPSQLTNKIGIQWKFAICLSSSAGVIFAGNSRCISLSGSDMSKSLVYTPLISKQGQGEIVLDGYYIKVKSIKINGKRLSMNTSLLSVGPQGIGGTKISTMVPYTTLETTIYETFTKAYIKVANSMNMTRVASVGRFGVCFSSKGIDKTGVGSTVPLIDLVLQSEMVQWRIYGRNSLVEVSDEVMCLGFLDGGLNSKASIVIGGYQLEDNLLEFNLGTSMLGFSSSLLMRETSCSDLKLHSMSGESL